MDRTLDGPHLRSLYLPLRLTYGLVPLLAGLDKFFNLLTDWDRYLAPGVASLLPVSAGTFFAIIGVVEMARNAGVDGLAVLCGAQPEAELRRCPQLDCLPEVGALPDWLGLAVAGAAAP